MNFGVITLPAAASEQDEVIERFLPSSDTTFHVGVGHTQTNLLQWVLFYLFPLFSLPAGEGNARLCMLKESPFSLAAHALLTVSWGGWSSLTGPRTKQKPISKLLSCMWLY